MGKDQRRHPHAWRRIDGQNRRDEAGIARLIGLNVQPFRQGDGQCDTSQGARMHPVGLDKGRNGGARPALRVNDTGRGQRERNGRQES